MGIAALISLIMGAVTSLAPDLLKEWRDGRQHDRELEFQREMSKLQVERAQIEAGALGLSDAQVDTMWATALQLG